MASYEKGSGKRRMTVMLGSMRAQTITAKQEKRAAVFNDAFCAEKNRHKKHIIQLASNFLYTADSLDEKLAALAKIGNISYSGGHEVACFAAQLLPYLLTLLEEDTTPRPMVLEIIWVLCQMCYQSPKVVEEIRQRSSSVCSLVSLLCDTCHVTESRAVCYLFTIMVANSNGLLFDFISKKYPELELGLKKAAQVVRTWSAWPCNLAERLMKIFGWGVVTVRQRDTENSTTNTIVGRSVISWNTRAC